MNQSSFQPKRRGNVKNNSSVNIRFFAKTHQKSLLKHQSWC